MPSRKTVHDYHGGKLRGHGRPVPHAGAGRAMPGLAGASGPYHLSLPAHAALLVVSILHDVPSHPCLTVTVGPARHNVNMSS